MFSALSCTAHSQWHALILYYRSTVCSASLQTQLCILRKVIEHRSSTVPLKVTGPAFPHCGTVHISLHLAPLRSAYRHCSVVCHSDHEDRSAPERHPDVDDQAGSLPRTTLSTGYEPNVNLTQNSPYFISVAHGDDEDVMTVENSQLKHHLLQYPKIKVFRRHGKTQEQFNEQLKDEEYREKFQCHRKFFLAILKTLFIPVPDDWRDDAYNALQIPAGTRRKCCPRTFDGKLMNKSKLQLLLL